METLQVPTGEISPAANRYLGTMQALHEFAEDNFGTQIIDHNFAPDHLPAEHSFGSMEGFSRELSRQIEAIPDSEPQANALRRNLASTQFFMEVLSGKVVIGKDIDYPTYIEKLYGVRPAPVPETIAEGGAGSLEAQRQAIEKAAQQLGYHFVPQDREPF